MLSQKLPPNHQRQQWRFQRVLTICGSGWLYSIVSDDRVLHVADAR
jgi:hypothetical protein